MSFTKAFPPALREIRILCSQTGSASAGTRQFILNRYPTIKDLNPDLPVLIREAKGTPARIFARFERGVEKHVELDNLSASDVETKVAQLLS
ncbi:thioredoxin-like protein [Lentinula edodes]|uniref:Nadh-ubiquinone oxidoreductase 105 kDa subunit n=1 Tax=Lentinula edodes TaxID=5353 RepID=A0A1Q3EIB8_LENED|nr:thioredoxin-like protein [Lentinula edodes]KAH7868569.1 thioredoxin-like protein [Lentinula edodes]KAJ3906987.1 thioredoxin-like protein [Lentinula edodes]KAJ3920103.1 thioredoxin-like protein [Lentinula edodes]GAW06931.1 nadh-ubiquinone oxidoreductase 105 kda subunit [Lentinula edodes]